DIFFSIKNHKVLNGWGWYLVGGIISFIMGIYLLIYPQVSIAILPFVVGFTVMFRSFQLLGTALDLRDAGVLRWGNLAVSSVLGLVLSFLLIANPLFSGISIVVLTALSFIFVGIASIILAFDLKKVKDYPGKIGDELKKKFDDLQDELEKTLK
ncbi:MAG: HdeD family acid-resistance protein, partial [Paludibacteraceae bacterium]